MRLVLGIKPETCGPCKVVTPLVEKITKEADIPALYVDAADNPQLADEVGVSGVPTVLVLQDGEELARHVGGAGEEYLRQMITG